jgi:hypothetical protein
LQSGEVGNESGGDNQEEILQLPGGIKIVTRRQQQGPAITIGTGKVQAQNYRKKDEKF